MLRKLFRKRRRTATFKLPQLNEPFSLELHPQGEAVSDIMFQHAVWEPTETEIFCKVIKPGDFVLDLGANIGYYSILSSMLSGLDGLVFSIEPNQENYYLLKRNISRNRRLNISALNAAAGNKKGTTELYHSDINYGDHRTSPIEGGARRSTVKLTTTDSIIQSVKKKPRLLKIDCQGAEGVILEGMINTIGDRKLRPEYIIIEFWPYGLHNHGVEPDEFLRHIFSINYKVIDIGSWSDQPSITNIDDMRSKISDELSIDSRNYTNFLLCDNLIDHSDATVI
ncbi:MAG: FkbM family methyltransferase [Azospirillaceae bacterium]